MSQQFFQKLELTQFHRPLNASHFDLRTNAAQSKRQKPRPLLFPLTQNGHLQNGRAAKGTFGRPATLQLHHFHHCSFHGFRESFVGCDVGCEIDESPKPILMLAKPNGNVGYDIMRFLEKYDTSYKCGALVLLGWRKRAPTKCPSKNSRL